MRGGHVAGGSASAEGSRLGLIGGGAAPGQHCRVSPPTPGMRLDSGRSRTDCALRDPLGPALGIQPHGSKQTRGFCGPGEKTGSKARSSHISVSPSLQGSPVASKPDAPLLVGRSVIPGPLSRDSLPSVGGRPLASVRLRCFQICQKPSFTDHLSGTHPLCKAKRAFPKEPGKGAPCARGNWRSKRGSSSLGVLSRSWKRVFSFPHIPGLVCYAAVVYFQSTLEFDRLSGRPASQLKPLAVWSMIQRVTVSPGNSRKEQPSASGQTGVSPGAAAAGAPARAAPQPLADGARASPRGSSLVGASCLKMFGPPWARPCARYRCGCWGGTAREAPAPAQGEPPRRWPPPPCTPSPPGAVRPWPRGGGLPQGPCDFKCWEPIE